LRRHDGEFRWILDFGVPRFNQDGSFAGYIGSCIDVTEHKRAEEARLMHAAIVESSEDAIISKNLDAVIVRWNAGAERLFGYTEAEAVGQPITILIPPELRDEENEILETLRAGGRIEHYETTRVTKGGKKVDVSLIISPIKDSTGRLTGFSKIAHDISNRKRAEELLRETNRALEKQTGVLATREELLKIFVKNVPAGVAMLDRDMRYLQVSDRWCVDFSLDSSQIIGRSHYEIFPDIPERWKQLLRRALNGETLRADEDRWDREGGTVWLRWEIRPWQNLDGLPGGILIFSEDITHRKQAEETLLGMSRKLIEAQEQERARIGRELHDDINQRLAMLALELDQLQENPSDVQTRLQELRKRTTELSNDVQALSHELHSSKLEYLGVVSGIKSWCKEFGERQKMEIDFKSDVSSVLPLEVGVCLFRVLQEALHNAVKHSGMKRIEVQLSEHLNEVHFLVRDSGKGFDWEMAMQGRGLGLTSMQERVRLLKGSIEIQSKPMGGTSIHVRVPFTSDSDSMWVAV
jgi:PAS domain S-box-containing protein